MATLTNLIALPFEEDGAGLDVVFVIVLVGVFILTH